jgi:hypothetical protein
VDGFDTGWWQQQRIPGGTWYCNVVPLRAEQAGGRLWLLLSPCGGCSQTEQRRLLWGQPRQERWEQRYTEKKRWAKGGYVPCHGMVDVDEHKRRPAWDRLGQRRLPLLVCWKWLFWRCADGGRVWKIRLPASHTRNRWSITRCSPHSLDLDGLPFGNVSIYHSAVCNGAMLKTGEHARTGSAAVMSPLWVERLMGRPD